MTKARPDAPPADWFFQPADMSRPQISPDGKRLVALARHDPRHAALVMIDIESGKPELLVRESEVTVSGFGWKADDLLVFVLTNDEGISRLHALNLKERKTRRLDHVDRGGLVEIVSLVPEDDVSAIYRSAGTLNRMDLRTGRTRPVERLLAGIDQWAIDPAGNVWAGTGYFGGKWSFVWRSEPDGAWQERDAGRLKQPSLVPLGVSRERARVVVLERLPGKPDRLAWFDLKSGATEELFQHESADVTGMGTWGFKREPALAIFGTDRTYEHAFHPDAADTYRVLHGTLPDSDVMCTSFSRDGQRATVIAWNDRDPGTYYLLDRATRRLEMIGPSRAALASQAFASGTGFEFKARDGSVLTGKITLPPGIAHPPVLLHLGPELVGARTQNTFDARTQFLASRGIGTVRIHARGTAGFGRDFLRAGDFKITSTVLDDLEDGLAAVADRIDSRRVGVLGEGWGGVTAIHAALRERFKVLVNFNAPTSVPHERVELLLPSDRSYEEATALLGGRAAANAYVDSVDPLVAAAKLRVPSFHYYGRGAAGHDIAAGGRALRSVLEKTSAPVHFHPDAPATTATPSELTRARYEALAQFLAKHL